MQEDPRSHGATGALVLADGTVFPGRGWGWRGAAVGELCFNTAMTGYQEVLTDPSYAEQLVCFTAPHIGNVGANSEDVESVSPAAATAARAAILRTTPTPPSNWRAHAAFDAWLAGRGIVAVSGVDTRALTVRIRDTGMPHAVAVHDPEGAFDFPALAARARDWPGIVGSELARGVTAEAFAPIRAPAWRAPDADPTTTARPPRRVVVMDYGVKRGILARLDAIGAEAILAPADADAQSVLAYRPDGIVLANGPGDPAATAAYAASEIRALIASGVPILGICLGHQLLALALGARTAKMAFGHHGANHPVQDRDTGQVEIVSMNHGFHVLPETLPADARETHVSLFDGSNCGFAVADKPIIAVQHHPEASPGPHDAFGVFERFAALMAAPVAPAASPA